MGPMVIGLSGDQSMFYSSKVCLTVVVRSR